MPRQTACATLAVGAPTVLAGVGPVPRSAGSFHSWFLVAIRQSLADRPAVEERRRFSHPARGAPRRRFHLGSDAARESDFPAAAAGYRSRAGVLGILRIRAGHRSTISPKVCRLGFLDRAGFFGSFYFDIAAVFAIAVAVSIAGLAFRRFVIRPKWLGPLSPESGIIALLIFLLMVTYLATFVPAGNRAVCCGGRTRSPFSCSCRWSRTPNICTCC